MERWVCTRALILPLTAMGVTETDEPGSETSVVYETCIYQTMMTDPVEML